MTTQLSWNTASAAATKEIFALAEGHTYKLTEILDLFNYFVDTYLNWENVEAPPAGDMETLNKESLWRSLGAMAIGWGKDNNRLMFEGSVAATLVRKQHDYGHNNIYRFGFIGILIRVHDKIARLENLILQEYNPNNESIDDTIMDIVGYSVIGMMWERNQFMLDLETKSSPPGSSPTTTTKLPGNIPAAL